MSWRDKIKDRPFRDDLEKDYCVKYLVQREIDLSRFVAIGTIFSIAVALMFSYNFQISGLSQGTIIVTHFPVLLLLPFMIRRLWYSVKLKFLLPPVNLFYIFSWLYASSQVPFSSQEYLPLYIVNLCFVSTFMGSLPFRNWVHSIFLVAVSLPAIVSFYTSNTSTLFILVYFGLIVLVSNLQIILHRNKRSHLISEFRDLERFIPHQIIRESLKSKEALSTIYKAEERFCVCMSSDWRSFQKATLTLPAQEVGDVLSSYYQKTSELLKSLLPNGNYFYDWIADELFVVIFSHSKSKDHEIAVSAFNFANRLLENRKSFERSYGVPMGVDIGISCGVSVIGIFGPQGQSKATAFGNVPGRSRRIQTFGNYLRQEFGYLDRIIFDSDFAQALPAHDNTYSSFNLQNMTVKDLEDEILFYANASTAINFSKYKNDNSDNIVEADSKRVI